jgi:transcriptional regulator with XRE-family HTH domain
MNLSEKIKHLREVEGELRGLNRPMTQLEIVKAMQEEQHQSLSQAYLSQLERGKRVHLTASSRDLLADFFKVHPGYLVSDPPDYSTDLLTDMENGTDRLQNWLIASAAEWRTEPAIAQFFSSLSNVDNQRRYLDLLRQLLSLPLGTLESIVETIMPDAEKVLE